MTTSTTFSGFSCTMLASMVRVHHHKPFEISWEHIFLNISLCYMMPNSYTILRRWSNFLFTYPEHLWCSGCIVHALKVKEAEVTHVDFCSARINRKVEELT